MFPVERPGPQRSGGRVGADDDARRDSFRAGEREFSGRGYVGKEAFPLAQQDGIDEQQDLISEPAV